MTLDPCFLDDLYDQARASINLRLSSRGAQAIAVPPVAAVTGACENIATTFRTDAGGYLVQTGQLFLEAAMRDHAHVSCDIWSSRDEVVDERHLAHFRLLEEEFRWSDVSETADPDDALNAVIDRATDVVRTCLSQVLEQHATELRSSQRYEALARARDLDWSTITHEQAMSTVLKRDPTRGDSPDFDAADEQVIVEAVSDSLPVFVTRYPEQIKFFNMRVDRTNSERVLSVDLLLPVAGEAVGGAVREDDPGVLEARLDTSHMLRDHIRAGGSVRDFDRYLDLVRSGLPPHAGYGLGLERLLQFVLGTPDIRSVSPTLQRARDLGWQSGC